VSWYYPPATLVNRFRTRSPHPWRRSGRVYELDRSDHGLGQRNFGDFVCFAVQPATGVVPLDAAVMGMPRDQKVNFAGRIEIPVGSALNDADGAVPSALCPVEQL
jgi:hypothetical protein